MNPDDEILEWDDVKEAAAEMFHVWVDGGELTFAEECWQHFTDAGLTKRTSILQEAETRLRLLSLAWVYLDFCLMKWDEGETDIYREIEALAEHLHLDDLSLGVLGGRVDNDDYASAEEPDGLREQLLRTMVRHQRTEIYNCLLAAYAGVDDLYLRLSRTPENTDESCYEDGAWSPSNQNLRALLFVEQGFQY